MPGVLERTITIVILCFMSGTTFFYPFIGITPDIDEEELAAVAGNIQQVFFLVYIPITMLVALNFQRTLVAAFACWPILLILALAFISCLWSIDAELTFRRSIALSVSTFLAFYLVGRYDLAGILKILTITAVVLIFGSYAMVGIDPAAAVHQNDDHAGAIRGVFSHKNQAGRTMVWLVVIIASAWALRAMSRPILIACAALAISFILATTSKTALISVLPVGAVVFTAYMLRGAALSTALMTLSVLAVVWYGSILLIWNYEAILLSIGRDPTFTGRTDIWAYTLKDVAERPLLGWGYEAYWWADPGPGQTFGAIRGLVTAHNSWIDTMLHFGVVGTVPLAFVALATLGRSAFIARYHENPGPAIFSAGVVLCWLTIGFSESIYIERNSMHWIIFVIAVGCARAYSSKLTEKEEEDNRALEASPGYAGNAD